MCKFGSFDKKLQTANLEAHVVRIAIFSRLVYLGLFFLPFLAVKALSIEL